MKYNELSVNEEKYFGIKNIIVIYIYILELLQEYLSIIGVN